MKKKADLECRAKRPDINIVPESEDRIKENHRMENTS